MTTKRRSELLPALIFLATSPLHLAAQQRIDRLAQAADTGASRGRATRVWLRRGAIGGAMGGAGAGAFLGLVVAGVCEYDCPSMPKAIAVGTLLGAVAGTAGGGLLGAIVGAAIPGQEGAVPARQPIGETRLTGRWARFGTGTSAGSAGADIALTAHFGGAAVGPEAGFEALGESERASYVPCVPPNGGAIDCFQQRPTRQSVWHVGGVARLERPTGSVRPYAVAGTGLYSWRTDFADYGTSLELLGYSLGGGVRWAPGPVGWGVIAEGRWHSNLSSSGGTDQPLGYWTAGVGASLRW